MLESRFFIYILLFFLIAIIVRWTLVEKFMDTDVHISNNGTKCEQCCNQLQQTSECNKKCIFDGAICRCCKNYSSHAK